MDWQCECGKCFKASWNSFLHGQAKCRCCARAKYHLIPFKKVKKDFDKRGYEAVLDHDVLMKDEVNFYCNTHKEYGIQNIDLSHFYGRGQGCKYCAEEKRGQNRATSKEKCKELTKNKSLNYIDSYVLNGKTVINFTCNLHFDKGIQRYTITQMQQTKHGCRYCNMSHYANEEKINCLLKSWNIPFERQISFKECRDKNTLPFDFYVPSFNLLIEYQGEQHYKPIQRGHKTIDQINKSFELTQKHDDIKRQYCKNNNINFIEIPYWENEDIENYLFQALVDLKLIIEEKSA